MEAAHYFRHLMPKLAGLFHLIAPDLPSFGFTTVEEGLCERAFVTAMYVFDYGAPEEPAPLRGSTSTATPIFVLYSTAMPRRRRRGNARGRGEHGAVGDYEAAGGGGRRPRWPATVLINAPQLPFERELCKEWNVPIPRLVVSGAVDAKTGAEIGTIRSEHAAALHLRETPGGDASVDRTVAVRTKIFRSFLLTPISPTTSCLATAPGIDFK